MNIVLISTYELGRQPFGLSSPAGWLRKRGHQVTSLDLSRQAFDDTAIRAANLIAFYVPMHTATRLTLRLLDPIRRLNSQAHLCAYGLYASLAQQTLQSHGVRSIFGGEFEESLVNLADHLSAARNAKADNDASFCSPSISLSRQRFEVPDRSGLASLRQYAHLVMPGERHRVAGYTEASRGCKHLCRHCPIVPVYGGIFRIVDREIVLADIRQQVAAGAEHITFGDPDFFNGIKHALAIVDAVHKEFPRLTYDATIKIEHLLQHEKHLPVLRDTGCLFVTSAVESLDNQILAKLEKGHTREDFLRVVEKFRDVGLSLQPTFVPFTPWTTVESYLHLVETLRELNLTESVAPIQLAIRLLIPPGSRLLELPEVSAMLGPLNEELLVYSWHHPDPCIDALCDKLQQIVASCERQKLPRTETFQKIWCAARTAAGFDAEMTSTLQLPILPSRATVPYLDEPWYC